MFRVWMEFSYHFSMRHAGGWPHFAVRESQTVVALPTSWYPSSHLYVTWSTLVNLSFNFKLSGASPLTGNGGWPHLWAESQDENRVDTGQVNRNLRNKSNLRWRNSPSSCSLMVTWFSDPSVAISGHLYTWWADMFHPVSAISEESAMGHRRSPAEIDWMRVPDGDVMDAVVRRFSNSWPTCTRFNRYVSWVNVL